MTRRTVDRCMYTISSWQRDPQALFNSQWSDFLKIDLLPSPVL